MSLAHHLCILLVMATFAPIQAVQYLVINNATSTLGGKRFENVIGIPYSQEVLQLASEFIWQIFKQANESERKDYQEVTMVVQEYTTVGAANCLLNSIRVSADYILKYNGDVRIEITGILYHENTHVWQGFGNGKAPSGLIEGIADYARLKAGLAPVHWVNRGSGSKWDEGYAVTAYFLEYCNWLKDGFVAELNALMKDSYSNDFFVQILGKSVDQLWIDYKSFYGN